MTDDPAQWDELCYTVRPSPEALAAALADAEAAIAALKAENRRLKVAFDDAVGELSVSEARVRELEAALGPLANLDAPPDWCPDDELLVDEYALRAGDVRRAKRALGEGK